jgi:Beta-1,4-xylanase
MNKLFTLAELAEKHGFKMGGAIGEYQMPSAAYKEMITSHFNSVTATNEMKAYSLVNQSSSQKNPKGMPVMDYSKADEIVGFAQENGMGVRGHVLVWDAFMIDWFYREGYDSENEYVDREIMKRRLKYYIEEVMRSF